MPAMVWLPARPSPMAAPMAPPPRASPPPVKAPASSIAFSKVAAIGLFVSLGVGSVAALLDGELVVEDGEQGEDERLDDADEHVEQLPRRREDEACYGELEGEADEKGDHDPAGEHVPEKPQSKRERLRYLLQDVQRDHDPRLPAQVAQVAAQAPGADRGGVGEHEDEDCEGVGEVYIRSRRREVVVVVEKPGQELDPVGDEHQHEDGHRERHHVAVLGTEALLDLVPHPADDQLPEQLHPARHAGGGTTAQVEPHTQDDQAGEDRRPYGVGVEGDPPDLGGDVLADGDVDGEDARGLTHRRPPPGGAGTGPTPRWHWSTSPAGTGPGRR